MAEKILVIADSITVAELADKLNIPVTGLIGELFKNGIAATINQRIDFETATIIVEELGLKDVELQKRAKVSLNGQKVHKLSSAAVGRPPIVAVMGHVDHGKTTLLDSILKMSVAEHEAGGITQSISAYQTMHKKRLITFLDTPGHEAFAALRQHSASLTDVVIIVVAADDGVKPQTIEAIKFARSANAKIVVAINKIDKPSIDIARVKSELAAEGLSPEEWGGDTVMVEISAKTGQNVDKLLDMVLLVADMEDLKADIDVPAEGLVIESHMETGRGAVVSLLIEQGILKNGLFLVTSTSYGKVRTLLDYAGKPIKEARPATPVVVTGFKELPQFGESFCVVSNEKDARRHIMAVRVEQEKNAASTNVTGSDLLKMMNQQDTAKEFNVIVKADVQGSLVSVIDSLKLIDTDDEVMVRIVGSGVGGVTENDIRLAQDKQTIIYGFNVGVSSAVRQSAVRDGVQIRLYKIIYELLDDAKISMESMLAPEVIETEVGKLTVKGIFRTEREEVIVGGEVTDGRITPGVFARVFRGGEKIVETEVKTVQRQQVEVKEVFAGEMCGLSLKTQHKVQLQEKDKIEFFTREIRKRKLK